MAVISISKLKTGDKLSEQVFTNRGSLLFDKGTLVSPREVEILHAFMISKVSIESKKGSELSHESGASNESDSARQEASPFTAEYQATVVLYRRTLYLAESGGDLPLLQIRNQMEALIRQIDQYNVLTFAPSNMNLKEYLLHNSIMIALTSCQLAKWQGLPQKDWMPAALGGLFHDIGNSRIDKSVLEKKEALTLQETEEIRKHTVLGYQILKGIAGLNEGVKLCALQHHEREDGSGYPLGLRSDQIHPYAKIVAVADIFHAMTSDRYHKKAISPYLVLEQLHLESFGKLDPSIVQTFIHKVTEFHNGTIVKLNDNRVGEIVFSDRNHPTRPWVNVNGTIVNLTSERNLFIEEVVSPS